MRILGMVTNTHDSSVALLQDGAIEMVVEEERLNRQKKTMQFPRQALRAVLNQCELTLADIDLITTPWNTKKLRRTFLKILLRGFPRSLNLLHQRAHVPQRNQIILLDRYVAAGLRETLGVRDLPPIRGIGHHDSHAAAFFVSPFRDATVLVMDGFGDDCSTSVYTGREHRLARQWSTAPLNSLGLVYTFVTEYLGFQGYRDEGKVMGLSAYGEPTYVDRFADVIQPTPDGRYRVNMRYFSYDKYGQIRPLKKKFFEVFGPSRRPDSPLEQRHRDLAFALQAQTENIILHVVRHLSRDFRSPNLVLSGGVALNCVANAKILEHTDYERIWVPPNASDTGATLGSALWHHHQVQGHRRGFQLRHAFYGCQYSEVEIAEALARSGLIYRRLTDQQLYQRIAADLAAGKIVGWFQGRFEMGPRALGSRSILADPRRPEMKEIINARVKHRESFRPFAPAVLAERAAEFFEIDQPDPFMTIAPRVRRGKEALIPAVVHADATGRFQTVEQQSSPRYWSVIKEFERLTGIPVVLNTSFNRQEPIVARPEEAISCFLRTEMDVLALGNFYSIDRNAAAIRQAEQTFQRRAA